MMVLRLLVLIAFNGYYSGAIQDETLDNFRVLNVNNTQQSKTTINQTRHLTVTYESSDPSIWSNKLLPNDILELENNVDNIPGSGNVVQGPCTISQHLIDLETMSNMMTHLRNMLSRRIFEKAPPLICKKICTTCNCSKKRVLVVYKEAEREFYNSPYMGLSSQIVIATRDLILLHGQKFLNQEILETEKMSVRCILDFISSSHYNSNLEEHKLMIQSAIRQLQRDCVVLNLYLDIFDKINQYFESAEITVIKNNVNTTYIRPCHSAFSGSDFERPVINMIYLKSLHMDIVELPAFAKTTFFAERLRNIEHVLRVDYDIAFNWEAASVTSDLRGNAATKMVRSQIISANPKVYPEKLFNSSSFRQLNSLALSDNLTAWETTQKSFYSANNKSNQSKKLHKKRSLSVPNDPYFKWQWALYKKSQASLNLGDAWSKMAYLEYSGPVTIAVIDTGLDLRHEDLVGQIWVNRDEIPDNGLDDDENGYVDDVNGWDFAANQPKPKDDDGHGTQVSGIIAALTNNRIGVASVCPFCKIMALKTTCARSDGRHTSTRSSILKAIDYALEKRVRVCNLSSTGPGSLVLKDAIIRAGELKMIIVAGAGNDGLNVDIEDSKPYPASYSLPHVVSVASLDRTGEISRFSNYGLESITLGAPGNFIWTTHLNGRYAKVSGTSFATPHVTGIIGFLLGVKTDIEHKEIIQTVIQGGDILPTCVVFPNSGKTKTGRAANLKNIVLNLTLEANYDYESQLRNVKNRSFVETNQKFSPHVELK